MLKSEMMLRSIGCALLGTLLVLGACVAESANAEPEPVAVATESEDLPSLTALTGARATHTGVPAASMQASAEIDQDRTTAIVRATGRVAPAVVSVSVLRTQIIRPRTVWERMMLPPNAQRRSGGFGSGVIVREDGIVLTNDHVITGADQILVTLADGREAQAAVVGTDPLADIAVLKIELADLPVAPVGSADGLLIGEWAIAIGNPLGNVVGDPQPTVTAGVVSAVDRNFRPSGEDEGFYFGMIQTDAAINPGNSGGALVNAAGELIGINASILSRSGGSEGLGFAIPIDRAMQIADDLVRYGEVRRAWLGIDVEPVDADEWGRTRGVRVSRVAPDSPGDEAALRAGDRLLAANGRTLGDPLDWQGVLLDLRVGDRLALEVEGQSRPVTLEADPFPSTTAPRVTVARDIELITVTPQIQAERELASSEGAYIVAISDELGRRIGLQAGDVIVAINRVRMQSAEDVQRAFEVLPPGRFQLYFERNGDYSVRNLSWSR